MRRLCKVPCRPLYTKGVRKMAAMRRVNSTTRIKQRAENMDERSVYENNGCNRQTVKPKTK
jgi:hypothetical protein